jgi:superfamily II DNA or RNA helicase
MHNSSNVVLRIDHNVTYIDGKLDREVYKKLRRYLGYLPEDYYWRVKHNKEKHEEEWRKKWDGYISTVCWNKNNCRCFNKKAGTHFHSGLVGKALQFLKKNNVNVSWKDERKKYQEKVDYSLSDEMERRDYQKETIEKALGVDRGIIQAATGSGKTIMASGIIAERGAIPAIFYVPSIDLLNQAQQEIERFVRYNNIPVEVGAIGAGKKEIKDITVMTIQTAVRSLGGKYVKFDDEDKTKDDTDIDDIKTEINDLIRSSKLMICDEVQHWASETCQIISDSSNSCQYRYGLSATPFRDKGDDILIEGCFGKVIANIDASLLIKKGFLVQPTIYFYPVKNMKRMKRTSYANVYKYGIVENEFRNNLIKNVAEGMMENGRNILILCKQINHGKLLEELIDGSVFLHGAHSAKKRKEHLDKMRTGEPNITIASVIFDEGIDCRPLNSLVLAGSGKSSTRALQRIGRVLRPYPGKKDAIVFDFMDHCDYMGKHSKKRKKMYRTESEFLIKDIAL